MWPEVLLAVQRQRRTTQILLESATVMGVDGSTLILSMPSAGMARRVDEQANSDLLRAALTEVLGVSWAIRCEATGSGRDSGGAPVGRSSAAGPRVKPSTRGESVPPPDAPPDDEIPDDYGDPPAAPASLRDPEEAAIELITAQLGGRRLEDDAAAT